MTVRDGCVGEHTYCHSHSFYPLYSLTSLSFLLYLCHFFICHFAYCLSVTFSLYISPLPALLSKFFLCICLLCFISQSSPFGPYFDVPIPMFSLLSNTTVAHLSVIGQGRPHQRWRTGLHVCISSVSPLHVLSAP